MGKVRLMSQVHWEAVLMQHVDVDVFTLLRTTHGSEASPGEAWVWVKHGPHMNQDGGWFVGGAGGLLHLWALSLYVWSQITDMGQ